MPDSPTPAVHLVVLPLPSVALRTILQYTMALTNDSSTRLGYVLSICAKSRLHHNIRGHLCS